MGDHRASIKVEFEMHGHAAKHEMWINWTPDDQTGVDRRVTEWFEAEAQKAMDKWWEAEEKAQDREQAEAENRERAELARLKAKFEPSNDT